MEAKPRWAMMFAQSICPVTPPHAPDTALIVMHNPLIMPLEHEGWDEASTELQVFYKRFWLQYRTHFPMIITGPSISDMLLPMANRVLGAVDSERLVMECVRLGIISILLREPYPDRCVRSSLAPPGATWVAMSMKMRFPLTTGIIEEYTPYCTEMFSKLLSLQDYSNQDDQPVIHLVSQDPYLSLYHLTDLENCSRKDVVAACDLLISDEWAILDSWKLPEGVLSEMRMTGPYNARIGAASIRPPCYYR